MYKATKNTVQRITEYPKEIAFQDLVAMVRIEQDPWPDNPLTSCDYWSHVCRCVAYRPWMHDSRRHFRKNGQWHRIDINPTGFDKYLQERGASKQVAYEKEKQYERESINYIRSIYLEGYEGYRLKISYAGLENSLWEIYSEQDARSQRKDFALDFAHQLEQVGFIITNKPKKERSSNLAEQNTKGRNDE